MEINPKKSHKSAFFTPFTDIIICPRPAPLVSHWVLTHGRFRFALEKKKKDSLLQKLRPHSLIPIFFFCRCVSATPPNRQKITHTDNTGSNSGLSPQKLSRPFSQSQTLPARQSGKPPIHIYCLVPETPALPHIKAART